MSDAASNNNAGNNFVDDDDEDDDGDGFEDYNPPADRFLTAQMWWIASELVRRHPHLRISGVEVDEGDRLLIVHDEQDAMRVQWDLVGGCKFLVNGVVNKIGWIQMMAALSPHETVKRIEVATGLGIPKVSPTTTPRALAYRIIANALATAVDARHAWYAVPASIFDDDHGYFEGFPSITDSWLAYFETAVVAASKDSRTTRFFEPFWAVLRDLEPIAIIDAAGVIHTIEGETELLAAYAQNNRNLTLTTARLLGPYLP